MKKFMSAGRSLLELLLILALGLVPVASGVVVLMYQLERKLEENSRISVEEALFVVDRVLDNLLQTAVEAIPYSGKACNTVVGHLQTLAAGDPRIHSVMLMEDNRVYCSSLPLIAPCDQYFTGVGPNVRLNFDSPTTPNGIIVEYSVPTSNPSVVATAYGLELRKELQGFQDGLTLILEFSGKYIGSQSDSRDPQPPSQTEFFVSAPSAKHDYLIKAGYPAGYTTREARQSIVGILPSLALVGLLTSAISYWGMFKRPNRKLRTPAKPR